MTPLLVAFLVLLAVALFVFWIEPLGFLPVLERLTPNFTYRVPTRSPLVALSFDDGPHPVFTPQVLEILQQHNAQATFFLIGERALRHPELVARIKAAGHELGNHYFTNGSLLLHSDANFVRYPKLDPRASKPIFPQSLYCIHGIGGMSGGYSSGPCSERVDFRGGSIPAPSLSRERIRLVQWVMRVKKASDEGAHGLTADHFEHLYELLHDACDWLNRIDPLKRYVEKWRPMRDLSDELYPPMLDLVPQMFLRIPIQS